MPDHPFTHAYIGLGLLDESSINRRRDIWRAEYRDAMGQPYLVVRVLKDHVRLEEFDAGKRVAMSVGPTLSRTIMIHGQGALGGVGSRFWLRIVRDLGNVWVQVSSADVTDGFIPAIAIGTLSIPLPGGMRWFPPEPGPIARSIGLAPFDEATHVMTGTLVRSIEGRAPSLQRVLVIRASMPGILIAEAAATYFEAYGHLRSIEWRPYVLPTPVDDVNRSWSIGPVALRDGALMTGFAVIVDPTAP